LPILFTDQAGDIVAACHAGWRGLVRGVIDQTLQEMINLKKPDDPFIYLSQLMAYIGPGIGPEFFEVGPEVRQAFLNCSADPQIAACFMATGIEDKYLANLFALARINLQSLGLHQIYCADHCTYSDSTHLYSYRRNKITGRFGSFIYLE
jgi:YfiH family protein